MQTQKSKALITTYNKIVYFWKDYILKRNSEK